MPGGRPPKYKPEYADKAIEYATNPEGERIPTKAGFACSIGVCRDSVHEWTKARDEKGALKYPEFSDAIKRLEAFQERSVIDGALSGVVNATFAIFFAKNNLGMSDRVVNEHTGADGGPIKTQAINFLPVGPEDK